MTDTIQILERKPETHPSGTFELVFDSADLSMLKPMKLADLLSLHTGIYIKSYGPGALASSSIRGGSAAHTQILWNGMPLTSPMHGQTDLNLLPLHMGDRVSVQMGGSAINGGNGAVTGIIRMDNTPAFERGLHLNASYSGGSFGTHNHLLSAGYSGKYISFNIQAWNNQSLNNFSFNNTALPDAPRILQYNAETRSTGIQSQIALKTTRMGTFRLNFLHLDANRNIPPLMQQSYTQAFQKDRNQNGVGNWSLNKKRFSHIAKTGISTGHLYFEDALSSMFSTNTSLFQFSEWETVYKLNKNHKFSLGGWQSYAQANTSVQNAITGKQQRLALIPAYVLNLPKPHLEFSLHLRQEWVALQHKPDFKTIPLMPAAGLVWNPGNNLTLRSSYAQVFRLPTLNDLYWPLSGNPDLQPESGWNMDAGISGNFTSSGIHIKPGVNYYFNYLNNRIQWLPGAYFWQPHNLMNTYARGLEAEIQTEYQASTWSTGISGRYHINKTWEAENPHLQLFYVPRNTMGGSFRIQNRKYTLAYHQTWNGFVFTSSDNTSWLPPFSTGDLQLERNIKSKKWNFRVWIMMRNLWNVSYQIMEGRPMPGRSILAGIDCNFNKPFKI